MQYATEIKKIGGSCYLRIPPKVAKHYKLKDKSEVQLRESNRLIIIETENPRIDKAARAFLNLNLNLGGMEFSREEIYETDRY